jgi:hypothetical protein
MGEGIDQLAALVHHAYLFWDAGSQTLSIAPEDLVELLGPASKPGEGSAKTARYVQLPARKIWAQVIPGQAPEPLDGCFVSGDVDPEILRVLGVFGMHPERPGFSVVEVVGPRPALLNRPNGSVPFASVLEGGVAAGLYSVAGEEELLELGIRGWELGARSLESHGERKRLHGQEGGGSGAGADRLVSRAQE